MVSFYEPFENKLERHFSHSPLMQSFSKNKISVDFPRTKMLSYIVMIQLSKIEKFNIAIVFSIHNVLFIS